MATTKPIDYEALYDEIMRVCLGPEYYSATKYPMELNATPIEATTLDEYLMLLRKGYINVDIRPELNKHLKELLEDSWFLQWPAIRCLYADKLLEIKGYDKRWAKYYQIATRIHDPLAKEGWPRAMAHIACCWFDNSDLGPKNPNRGICLMLEASRKGYRGAQGFLNWEYCSDHYKNYCEEIQMFIVNEAITWVLVRNGATKENYRELLSECDVIKIDQMKNKGKKLEAVVTERMYLRTTTTNLFWYKGESPYEIDFLGILNGQN